MKVISCADPVGLFCKFSGPVTLMHGVFLLLRLCTYPIHAIGYLWVSIAGLVGVGAALYNFYRRWSPKAICGHSSVWKLTAIALLAALCTTSVDDYLIPKRTQTWQSFASTFLGRRTPTSSSWLSCLHS